MEFKHISVLLNECIESLDIKPDGIYADGTAGGAGHSCEIAKRLNQGKLYAFDRDPDAVQIASERLKDYNAEVIESNFSEMKEKLAERGSYFLAPYFVFSSLKCYNLLSMRVSAY